MRMERGILSPYYETAEKYVCDAQRHSLNEYETENGVYPIFYKIGFFLISIHTGNITDFPNLSILVFSYIFPKFMKKCIPNSHIMPINLLYSCK